MEAFRYSNFLVENLKDQANSAFNEIAIIAPRDSSNDSVYFDMYARVKLAKINIIDAQVFDEIV